MDIRLFLGLYHGTVVKNVSDWIQEYNIPFYESGSDILHVKIETLTYTRTSRVDEDGRIIFKN